MSNQYTTVPNKIHELVCPKCGDSVSGPDPKSVKEVMDRHIKGRHPEKKAVKK